VCAGMAAVVVAGVVARVVAAVVTVAAVAAEQAAAARLTAFPMAQGHQVLLVDGFLDVLPDFLADFAFFANGHFVADLANFFLLDRDALHAGDGSRLFDGNGFAAEAFDGFGFALDLVHGPFDGVGLRDALGRTDGPSGRGTWRSTMISPSG